MKFVKTLFLAFLLIAFKPNFAQDTMQLEQKIFIDQDGRLVVNKALPLYLWISTSADEGAQKYLLESEKNKKYSNPFYLDTEGKNTVRKFPIVDNQTKRVVQYTDLIFEVYSDGLPPASSIKYIDAKASYKAGKRYYKLGLKLQVSAWDAISGVEKILVKINNQPYTAYQNPIAFNQSGEYEIKYYSTDKAGNQETEKTLHLLIE